MIAHQFQPAEAFDLFEYGVAVDEQGIPLFLAEWPMVHQKKAQALLPLKEARGAGEAGFW
jgi:hypothetical protein